MELLDFNKGVVGLLAVVGVALTTVMFNSYQDDSKLIQTILLNQQAADIKLTAILEDTSDNKNKVVQLEEAQVDTNLQLLQMKLQIEGLLKVEKDKRN